MASLEHLLALAKKTKSTLIIHDASGGEDFVVLSLAAYERLVDGEGERVSPATSVSRSSVKQESLPRLKVPDFPPPPPMPAVRDLDKETPPPSAPLPQTPPSLPLPPLTTPLVSGAEEGTKSESKNETFSEKEAPLLPEQSPEKKLGWHSAGAVLRDRFTSGEWLRPKDDETRPELRGKKPARDQDEDDDPVFYPEREV